MHFEDLILFREDRDEAVQILIRSMWNYVIVKLS